VGPGRRPLKRGRRRRSPMRRRCRPRLLNPRLVLLRLNLLVGVSPRARAMQNGSSCRSSALCDGLIPAFRAALRLCACRLVGGVVKLSGPREPQPGLTHMRESFMVALRPDDLVEQPTLELERGRLAPDRRVVRLERRERHWRRTVVSCLVGCVAAGALAVALLRRPAGESGLHQKATVDHGHVASARGCTVACGVNARRAGRVALRSHARAGRCLSSGSSPRSAGCGVRRHRRAVDVRRGMRVMLPPVVVEQPPVDAPRPAAVVAPSVVQRVAVPVSKPAGESPAEREGAVSEFGFEGHGR
jgi:hypothetical protein